MTFVEAAHHGGARASTRFIVVHTTENDQDVTAMQVADFFAHEANPTSAHGVVDDTEVVRCVRDPDIAYHCGPHGNEQGLGLEHIGHAAWTAAQWATPYTNRMLALSAAQIAAWCRLYHIPAVKINAQDLLMGRRGICGHADVTHAYPSDTSHTDPGYSWPWAKHIGLIRAILNPTPGDDMTVDEFKALLHSDPDVRKDIATAVLGYHNDTAAPYPQPATEKLDVFGLIRKSANP